MRGEKERHIFKCKSCLIIQTQECPLQGLYFYFSDVLFVLAGEDQVRTQLSPMGRCVLNHRVLWALAGRQVSKLAREQLFTVSKGSKCHSRTFTLSILQMQIEIKAVE